MTNERPVPRPPKQPLTVEKKVFVLKEHLTNRPFSGLQTELEKKEEK